jgi:hypothetical protein
MIKTKLDVFYEIKYGHISKKYLLFSVNFIEKVIYRRIRVIFLYNKGKSA